MIDDDIIIKRYQESTLRRSIQNRPNTNDQIDTQSGLNSKKKKLLLLISIIIIIILILIFIIIYFSIIKKRKVEEDITNQTKSESENPFSIITPEYNKDNKKLESEFEFKTIVGDLRRIYVNQKYQEDRLYEGNKITRIKERKTNYDIFILSESEPEPEYINYYNKIYTASISIESECFGNENEDCEPVTLLDLGGPEKRNIRNLEETENLKDIPIPFCLFNFTNNDVITSIACPKSFSEDKKKLMVLDLYFFRPPGIKRIDREELNVTVTKKLEGENIIIRETNGGICDIENSFSSFCTTDMNTTTDKEGRILYYEEEADMNIEKDELNNYKKNKRKKIFFKTNKIISLAPQKFNSTINKLLPIMKENLKYDELFSKDDFEEILLISKKGINSLKELKKRKNGRFLEDENPLASIESTLLEFDGNAGVKIELSLMNNPGIRNEFMEGNSKLKIENKNKELTSSKKSSLSINEIINELIKLSQAGNNLATQLYQNTNNSLDIMTDYINERITYLKSLIKYQDISDIFYATLSLDSINKLPDAIIQETSNLKNNLEQILNNIENGRIKKNIKILNSNIYDYTEESHNIINKLFENISELSKSLSSDKTKLVDISTYYLNNTSNSYTSTIENAEKILKNYYKDEFSLINAEVDKILKLTEESLINSLQKQINIINNLYQKVENHNYTIQDANEEEYKTLLNNLYYLKNYMNQLIKKIKDKITKEMNKKDNGYLMTDYDINSNEERSTDVLTKAKEIAKNLENDTYIDKKFDEVMKNLRQNFTNIQKFMDKEKEEKFPLNEHILKEEFFNQNILNNMQNEINNKGVNILNSIRNENDEYLKEKNRVIEEFIRNDRQYLNTLTFEIDSKFTERKLGELKNLYEIAYKSCLEKTKNELNNNYNIASKYFTDLAALIQDNNKIIELLRGYKSDRTTLLKYNPYSSLRSYSFQDSISSKYKTNGYLNKYRTFIESFAISKEFINNQVYGQLLSEYKNLMFKLREVLQIFKNNKMSGKYPDTSEFFFIDDNIKTIDNLYKRLNNEISDSFFNENLIKPFNNIIIQKHNIINTPLTSANINYDFCINFKRKISYTCTNGCVSTKTTTDEFCFPVSNTYQNLLKHSIYTDSNYIKFKNSFNIFYNEIYDKINKYTSKINNLKWTIKCRKNCNK